MKKLLIAAAIGTTAIGGVAIAAAFAPHGMMRADTNADGKVSRNEFFAMANARFKTLDANSDGKVAITEMIGPPQRMARIDTNGDGSISRDEFAAMTNAHFKRVDSNGDAQITEAELKAEHDRRHAMHGGRHGAGGHGRPHHMGIDGPDGPNWGRGPGGPGGMMARLDSDGDGKITRAEFTAPFDRIDANKDGVVDQAEQQAQRDRMRDAMRQRMMERRAAPANGAAPAANPSPPTGQ